MYIEKKLRKEMIKTSHKGRKKCTFNAATILQLAIFTILVRYDQSHYIEVAQGDIFMEQKIVIWAGFGPIGNTEKKKFGPIMSNFRGRVFHVFRYKKNL